MPSDNDTFLFRNGISHQAPYVRYVFLTAIPRAAPTELGICLVVPFL